VSSPSSPPATAIEQHNTEIHENLRHWERKPALRREYQRFYQEIARRLADIPAGPVLECGSGIGNIKSALPDAITSDLFPNPWLDRRENVFALSYGDNTLAGLVLFDVFHHLRYPGTALREMHRVLQPGGRIVIFEPAAGLLGRLALGLFHHEPVALRQPITWEAPAGFDPQATDYYAAQGNAWRVFRSPDPARPLPAGCVLREVTCYPALPWLLTGGFRGPTLCPEWLRPLAAGLDRLLSLAPQWSATRMIIVLEKTGPTA
jgi:SAM-dependent methyltransferase